MAARTVVRAACVAAGSLALAGIGGAAATSAATSALDLSTPEAIEAYLTSKGVDPATVVWQTGERNYAGPNCPGAGWNCTTATKVVQLAPPGGQNSAECAGIACITVQNGPDNGVECTETTDGGSLVAQKCLVAQVGERNKAIVRMLIRQTTGAVQDARQAVEADQTATEKNDLHIFMTVKQSSKDVEAGAQKQDAHQAAFVFQEQTGADGATGTAGNFLHVHMVQDQDLSGAATLQEQNTDPAPIDSQQGMDFDCAPFHKPAEPNQCVNVDQQSDGNMNLTQLHQTIDQDAVTRLEGATTQNQGREDGGIEGFTELVNPPDLGQNVDKAHQVVKQRADRPDAPPEVTVIQDQDTDPSCCGFGTSIGGKASQEDVKQFVTQSASSPTATQFAALSGETTVLAEDEEVEILQNGETTTQGSGCKVLHHARNNDDAEHVRASAPAPCALVVVTTCGSPNDGVDEIDLLQENGECVTTSDGEDAVLSILPTSATFGLPLEPVDFGEPEDFIEP